MRLFRRRRREPDDITGAINALLDVNFALVRMLEAKGLVERAAVAQLLAAMCEQLAAQNADPARIRIIELMAEAFARPLAGTEARSRLKLVE
jgi:hypothetical protein